MCVGWSVCKWAKGWCIFAATMPDLHDAWKITIILIFVGLASRAASNRNTKKGNGEKKNGKAMELVEE